MEHSKSSQNNSAVQSPKNIFILSGQSNMAGRGGVDKHKHWDGVVPSQCSPDPSKIFRFSAQRHWEVAAEPLHYDIDTKKTCGVGPGMSFSNAMKESVGVMGLVPCAVGGTALKEWARGELLYENMVSRAKAAICGDGCEIKGLLWYQGESDTLSKQDAESYKSNMETLIHNFRCDMNLPSLPIVQVAIASGDEKYIGEVRKSQKMINLPNVVCVDALGLQLKDDKLHLTTEAQVQLGKMLAEAYLTHFAQNISSSADL
ncbi:unnamed protein product [Cuscuta epithymum]|uniref:Sialate O-acetylesterase domain-containing protein n=1 Tax=Cuscuta epithymum TaxID=186058 RepID=A0AAV0CFG4_9ASTE|nr:unnamed protein product [Cuscuta epithymum]CAH9141084.1 unnamed protein product [Cuscuta epithymum]